MKAKPILTTQPHGEHTVRQLEPKDDGPLLNRLFVITNKSGDEVALAGEELSSLAKQWLHHVEQHTDFCVCQLCDRTKRKV
ncbi:MAG: hypothetical protein NTZ16_12590 [Verrucomicrobia bacterium]|nr:hypothetical protein [Verrucomicrobiota bacterium]